MLVIDLVIATPTSMATALALTVVVLLAVAWMAATVVGLFRGQAWIRASAITWQVLQFAIGLGALQGEWAQPAWGWPILVVAVVTFLLMFSRDVINATATRAAND